MGVSSSRFSDTARLDELFDHMGKIPPVLDSENFLLHLRNYFLYNKGACQMGFVGELLTITSQSGKGFPRDILGS